MSPSKAPHTAIYYRYSSIIDKKDGPQPKQVNKEGLWLPHLNDGIVKIDTGSSEYFETALHSMSPKPNLEIRKALKSTQRTFHLPNRTIEVRQIGRLNLDASTPESIMALTRERLEELYHMLRNGSKNKQNAENEIQAALDDARQLTATIDTRPSANARRRIRALGAWTKASANNPQLIGGLPSKEY